MTLGEPFVLLAVPIAIAVALGIWIAVRARPARSARTGDRVFQPSGNGGVPHPVVPATQARDPVAAGPAGTGEPVPWSDDLLAQLEVAVHARAFDVPNFQYYPLQDEHAEVFEAVVRRLPDATSRREYFPRMPQVLPRLMAALRSDDGSLAELQTIVMRDPVLTGDVLRMANSAFYRASQEPVDSIGRALVTLGTEGLRAVVAGSVLQPVFTNPRGYFDSFSPTVWQQAQSAALAAQLYARTTRCCDAFAAHLLALLFHVSHIVLFRMTSSAYLDAPGCAPRADVFARLIDERAELLARDIVRAWELPDAMVHALEEHAGRLPVSELSPLARALYVGRICGMASAVAGPEGTEDTGLPALLERKGVAPEQARAIWAATRSHARAA
jgi:HD-like signal output (HDOD) protein